jgi:hypothetical protein
MKTLFVAKRYPCPGPRYKSLGPGSGEVFREWIMSELEQDLDLTINLDGTEGYGSSFLEEGFGGLIREGVPSLVVHNIKLISIEEPDLVVEIEQYIEDAISERDK